MRRCQLLHNRAFAWLREQISGRVSLQNVLKNSGWLLVDQLLRVGVGALVTIWVARHLGPDRFGAFSFALALVGLCAPLATFGLDNLVVRDLVKAPQIASRLLASAITLRLCTGFLSVLVAVILAIVVRPGDRETLALTLIIASAAIFQALSVLDFWYQSKLQSKFSVISRNLAFMAASGTKIWCVLSDAPLEMFGLAVLVEAAVGALGLVSIFRLTGQHYFDMRLAESKIILSYIYEARNLVLTGLMIMIYMRVDRIIIGAVLDNNAVGLYSVATQLCEIFYILPTIVLSSVYPIFVQLYGRDESLYTKRLIQVMRAFFYTGLSIAVFFTLFADLFVISLFGSQYAEAVPITKIYIYSLPLIGMSIIFSHRYVLQGKTMHSLIGVIVGGISMLLLSYLVIPNYGPVGAAWVALLSQAIPSLVITLLLDRTVGLIFIKAIAPWSRP